MRIVFIGAVEFSYRALEKLIALDADIVGVFTQTDQGINADFRDLGEICRRYDIPLRRGENVNTDSAIDWIKTRSPDVIFCFGWSRLLNRELLEVPPKGVVGFHPSALPNNRGRHPLIWALVLGLSETKTSFFFMDELADTGDLISQRTITIAADDDASILYNKVIKTAIEQLEELLPLLKTGKVLRLKQEPGQGNIWRKRSTLDGRIDWRMSATAIYNLVRGLARPYVGAHFLLNGEIIKVWKCEVVSCALLNIEPGKIIEVDDTRQVVKCGDGALMLLETDPPIEVKLGDYL